MRCLLDQRANCPVSNNENGDYCWGCSYDAQMVRYTERHPSPLPIKLSDNGEKK